MKCTLRSATNWTFFWCFANYSISTHRTDEDFIKFLNNEFSLESLKILSRYNGLRFKDLDPLLQSRIEDYQIQSYVILPPTDETVKFHIFDRVNRPGTQLNKQEIRNALYNGKITELLKEIAESALFREATSNKFVKDNDINLTKNELGILNKNFEKM